MELVCIDFVVAGGGKASGVWHRSTARAKFFPFFAFSLPPLPLRPSRLLLRATLPVDKLFSFCAASRFLMPPTQVKQLQPPFTSSSPLGPFCSSFAASFSIDFRGFAAKQSSQGQLDLPQLGVWVFFFYFRAMLHLRPVLLAAPVAVVAPVFVVASTLLCAQRSIEKFKCSAV